MLWGVAGAVLAVPLTSVFAIALKGSRHAYADFIVVVLEEFRLDLKLLADGGPDTDGSAGVAGAEAAEDDPTDQAVPAAANPATLRLRSPR